MSPLISRGLYDWLKRLSGLLTFLFWFRNVKLNLSSKGQHILFLCMFVVTLLFDIKAQGRIHFVIHLSWSTRLYCNHTNTK